MTRNMIIDFAQNTSSCDYYIIGASLSEPHSYVETYVKMVGWSMRDKQRRKTGMQHTSVVW